MLGSLIAFKAILLNTWLIKVDWVNISLIAKSPTTTGIKPIPSVNSLIPKVKRSIEVIKSLPTVEINIPNAPAIKFLIGLPSPIDASIVKPNIANAKYSGWPNSYASCANIGAKKTNITTLKIPPTVLDTVAIPKALPASPFCANG